MGDWDEVDRWNRETFGGTDVMYHAKGIEERPTQATIISQATIIMEEYVRARQKFAPMRGPHEGYAVILEELDEMWDAIKSNDIPHARKECLQVAAMCLAFLLEVKDHG